MFATWTKSFRNVAEVPPTRLEGRVPKTISGRLLRCGPGVFNEFGSPVAHPFDGDGFVASYQFEDGEVTYQARVVETAHRTEERRLGHRAFSGAFGTAPLLRAIKNAANTNVVAWGGCVLVFHEAGVPHVLDEDLRTLGTLAPFRPGFPMGDAVCAHPKVCGNRLVLFTLSYTLQTTLVTFYELHEDLTVAHKVSS